MDTPELFPGEHKVREEAARAGWSTSVGNGWAALFESPDDDNVTLRAYASFYEAGVRPAFLLVETLDGDPTRAPRWGCRSGSAHGFPRPRRRWHFLGEHGVACRVGELMPEDLTMEAQ
jgi:hypothetical protein